MSARRSAHAYRPEPVETPEPAPVTCECTRVQVTGGKLLTIHTRACAGISDLAAVPELAPCDVCGGPAPCASCAAWSIPPVGTAVVCTIRPLDARPVKTFKGIITRIDQADPVDSEGNGGWPAGIVVNYPAMKHKKTVGVSVFHAWPSPWVEAVAP
jgi:hypothetical protein